MTTRRQKVQLKKVRTLFGTETREMTTPERVYLSAVGAQDAVHDRFTQIGYRYFPQVRSSYVPTGWAKDCFIFDGYVPDLHAIIEVKGGTEDIGSLFAKWWIHLSMLRDGVYDRVDQLPACTRTDKPILLFVIAGDIWSSSHVATFRHEIETWQRMGIPNLERFHLISDHDITPMKLNGIVKYANCNRQYVGQGKLF